MTNSGEFLNNCSNVFNKFFKILQNVFYEYIFAECHFKPKFWRRHCSTGLEWNSCMKFCSLFSPNQNKIWRRPWFSSCYYNFSRWSYWHFCIQFCSSIKFYSVIFCIFCGILYFTTLKEIRFPRGKILEPPLINISLKLY